MRASLGFFAACVLIAGCSTSSGSSDSAMGAYPPGPDGVPSSGKDSSSATGSSQGNGGVEAGILTAGAWDDNRNFDFFKAYLSVKEKALGGLPIFSADERGAAATQWGGDRAGKQVIDVAFLLDVTGSMGDELSYLQREIDAIGGAISTQFPGADPRWGLVAYKDVHDDFTVRSFDFGSSLADFKTHLDAQSAGGGEDYPEAVEQGLGAATKLTWRGGEGAAKIVFWVADAPHHEDKTQAVVSALETLKQSSVHVYPIAASGADERTEYTMRTAAQLTGGRYLFLTDDSGVGDTHKEPIIPCYFVTKLDDALVRMVSVEMTGKYREPEASQVIREGGNPANGRCTLEGGQAVTAF